MEAEYIFKIYYRNEYICEILARSEWEAKEKAWMKFSPTRPLLKRDKFKAKIKK